MQLPQPQPQPHPAAQKATPPPAPTAARTPGRDPRCTHCKKCTFQEGAVGGMARPGGPRERGSSENGGRPASRPPRPGASRLPSGGGGESEWIKCLIPTAHPSVRLRRESGRGHPHPSPPPLIAVLPSERRGRGPEGQSRVSPSILLCRGGGRGLGNRCAPQRPSASALHPGATPSPVPQPEGGYGLHFPLPKAGTAGERTAAGPPEGLPSWTGWGSGGGGASTSGPLRLHRGPPSAKHFR